MRYVIILLFVLTACSSKNQYDVNGYYTLPEQDKILTNILTYIMDAPPMTPMADRFDKKHYNHYSFLTSKFSIVKYFIADDGTHYFYVMRPGPKAGEKRGVGGHYHMTKDFKISDFREVFVTTIQSEADIKDKSSFLFDEMAKGTIDQYLKMPTYVQWPNEASYYDTITYEWKLKPEFQ